MPPAISGMPLATRRKRNRIRRPVQHRLMLSSEMKNLSFARMGARIDTFQCGFVPIAVRINSIKPLPIIGFSMTGIPTLEARVFNAGVTFPLMRIAGNFEALLSQGCDKFKSGHMWHILIDNEAPTVTRVPPRVPILVRSRMCARQSHQSQVRI